MAEAPVRSFRIAGAQRKHTRPPKRPAGLPLLCQWGLGAADADGYGVESAAHVVWFFAYSAVVEPALLAFDPSVAPLRSASSVTLLVGGILSTIDVVRFRGGRRVADYLVSVPLCVQLVLLALSSSDSEYAQRVVGLRYVQLLRLVRLLRLQPPMCAMREVSLSSEGARGAWLVFVGWIMVVIHLMACSYLYVAHVADVSESWLAQDGRLLDSAPYGARYIAALYWATATATTVGFGDIAASTSAEQVVAIVNMVVGAGTFMLTVRCVFKLFEGGAA